MKNKTDKKSGENLEIVKEIVQKILDLIGIKASIDVSEDEENNSINVELDASENSGLLIGNRGTNLYSLQVILNLILRQKSGEWRRVLVNVSDWRDKEEQRLQTLAQQTAERVRTTGESQNLYNLAPNERRIVHMVLADEKDITTESFGEGRERYLVVNLKK